MHAYMKAVRGGFMKNCEWRDGMVLKSQAEQPVALMGSSDAVGCNSPIRARASSLGGKRRVYLTSCAPPFLAPALS